jgi:chaperonin GroEL (HSP60 family)
MQHNKNPRLACWSGFSSLTPAQIGDATNLVVILAGELLQKAEYLLRMGLHPSEVVDGYTKSLASALEILDSKQRCVCSAR